MTMSTDLELFTATGDLMIKDLEQHLPGKLRGERIHSLFEDKGIARFSFEQYERTSFLSYPSALSHHSCHGRVDTLL